MATHNETKETSERENISDQEIWSAIRYLDLDPDHRDSDIATAVAVVAIVFIVCVVTVFLRRL